MGFGLWRSTAYSRTERRRRKKGGAGKSRRVKGADGKPIRTYTTAPKDGRPFVCETKRNKAGTKMLCTPEPLFCMGARELSKLRGKG